MFIISPQNRTSCGTVDLHTATLISTKLNYRVLSDILAGVHTFIHAVGINLSVFAAEGIHYGPNS